MAGDCRSVALPHDIDAAVGRCVLFYTSDITETLRSVANRVTPGGVVAFAELDFNTILGYLQAGPAGVNRSAWEWMIATSTSAGIPTRMIAPLYRAFLAAGLGAPPMALQTFLFGADDLDGFALFAAALRSLLPLLEREGIVSAEVLAGDTLAERCRAEVIETGVPLMFLPVVTAWARKPLVL